MARTKKPRRRKRSIPTWISLPIPVRQKLDTKAAEVGDSTSGLGAKLIERGLEVA